MAEFEPPYWVVWNEDGDTPTKKHKDYERARGEAQRLARQYPGKRFAVLAAATAFIKDDVREVRFSPYDDIPF